MTDHSDANEAETMNDPAAQAETDGDADDVELPDGDLSTIEVELDPARQKMWEMALAKGGDIARETVEGHLLDAVEHVYDNRDQLAEVRVRAEMQSEAQRQQGRAAAEGMVQELQQTPLGEAPDE